VVGDGIMVTVARSYSILSRWQKGSNIITVSSAIFVVIETIAGKRLAESYVSYMTGKHRG
jgi:hypothetical protein